MNGLRPPAKEPFESWDQAATGVEAADARRLRKTMVAKKRNQIVDASSGLVDQLQASNKFTTQVTTHLEERRTHLTATFISVKEEKKSGVRYERNLY